MSCCVWFRMQLEVEDAKTASYECCILHAEQEAVASRVTSHQTDKDINIDCCVTSNLIAGSFYILSSEARTCDDSCAPWPREGKGDSKGLRCSCYNYIGQAKWQRIPGVPALNLEVECAVEDCHFRLLEDEVRNERHAWMRKMLQEEVFVNSSTREELTAVLRREQIDTELSGEESVDPRGKSTVGGPRGDPDRSCHESNLLARRTTRVPAGEGCARIFRQVKSFYGKYHIYYARPRAIISALPKASLSQVPNIRP